MDYERPARIVVYEGLYRRVVWVPDASGRYRGKEYFESLGVRERAPLNATIERYCDFEVGLRDSRKFRNEGSGFWAFKRYQDRLVCFLDGRDVCITHGLKKKQDRLPSKEIKIAKSIRDHNLTEGGRS